VSEGSGRGDEEGRVLDWSLEVSRDKEHFGYTPVVSVRVANKGLRDPAADITRHTWAVQMVIRRKELPLADRGKRERQNGSLSKERPLAQVARGKG